MNIYPHAAIDGDDAQLALSQLVNLFLFDLRNEASEHGFAPGHSWILQLATNEELSGLRKYHYPIVSLKLQPDILLDVFRHLKSKLKQALNEKEATLTVGDAIKDGLGQIAAYPALTLRG